MLENNGLSIQRKLFFHSVVCTLDISSGMIVFFECVIISDTPPNDAEIGLLEIIFMQKNNNYKEK